MRNCELLAPAGDRKSLECAIYNGADAVYLGLSNFNARIKADNFTNDNIAEIISFAHLYNVKIYITVNTLVKDGEVKDFLDMVKVAVEAKADAFIVQDFGMAKLLQDNFRGINLHASTQMGIHNLQGAIALEKLGFTRVVLARETKMQDIIEIKNNTNLEIEYFVQGALCVAFSGNCYLSAVKNGNSGNRGKCLQLCRLPYKLYDKDNLIGEGYYLSPKDLSLMSNLEQLLDAGVTSLKIEGRLKRPSYVAQVVRSYRRLLDNRETNIIKEQKKIQDIFSRGAFNENAYLYDNFDIINTKFSNHQGRKIGKVIKVEPFKNIYKITLNVSEDLGEGDAIRLVKDKNIISIGVGNVNKPGNDKYEIFSTQKALVDSDVYLLKSVKKEANLTDYVRSLHINMHLLAKVGSNAILQVTYKTITIEVSSNEVVQMAKTRPIEYEDVYKQLSKLNDTCFVLDVLTCDIDNVFIAVSVLNDLRRKAIENLKKEILHLYEMTMPKVEVPKEYSLTLEKFSTTYQNFVIIDDVNSLGNIQNYDIIYCPSIWEKKVIINDINTLLNRGYTNKQIYLDLPIVSTGEEMKNIENILTSLGDIGIVVNNYSGINLASRYRAIAGLGLNIYNSFTASRYLSMGFINYIYSLESDIFSATSGIVYSKGNPTLMTLCHCPIRVALGGDCKHCKYTKNLIYEDEKHNKYALRRLKQQHCYFGLYPLEKIERKTEHSKIIDLRII